MPASGNEDATLTLRVSIDSSNSYTTTAATYTALTPEAAEKFITPIIWYDAGDKRCGSYSVSVMGPGESGYGTCPLMPFYTNSSGGGIPSSVSVSYKVIEGYYKALNKVNPASLL